MKKKLIGFVVLVLFCLSALPLYAESDVYDRIATEKEQPSGEAMIADVLIARPISLVALVIGTGVSIVATPFALASGTTKEVYGKLVKEPFNYMTVRPLGEGW